MANTWIITTTNQIENLVNVGKKIGGTVTAIVVGDAKVGGVDSVIRIDKAADKPAEAYAPAVVAAAAAAAGDVVLASNRPAERVLAGAVAATLNAPVLTGAVDVETGKAKLARFGGITEQNVEFSSAAVAILDGGQVVEGDVAGSAGSDQSYDATIISTDKSDVTEVNLGAAKRIVSVGRGFKTKEDIALADAFAAAIGADVACSRPIAEGAQWLTRDRYVGVSGQHVTPDLYIAVGISGQIQHTAGMKDSKVVVAINSDDKAPIFEMADYGIVGDLYQILPALTAAAK